MSPFLVREDQPPHIHVRGDGRLKNEQHQLTYQSIYPFVYLYPYTYASRSSMSRPCRRVAEPRGSRGRSGRPRAANRRRLPLTGSLPRNWGVWYQKRRLTVLRIALEAGLLRCELWSISLDAAGTRILGVVDQTP